MIRPALHGAMTSARRCAVAWIVVASCTASTNRPALADALARASAAYHSGNYVRAVKVLRPLALAGNAKAEGLLGFMYENGFGVPQTYQVAVDFYTQAANKGDSFAQSMLGLMYDKGHGVKQDYPVAYKWLDLAAASAPGSQRDYYLRLRDALTTKMSSEQIVEGQRLAQAWALEHQ